jgi:hypothetical protein
MQHAPINNPAGHRLEEVGVFDFRMAAEQLRFHLDHRLLGIAPGTIGILFGVEGRPQRSVPAPASLLSCRLHARRALVRAALGIGMGQDILTADLVVQGIEAIAGFCLRFRVQRRLQFLNTLRS